MKDYDPKSSFADDHATHFHDQRGDEADTVTYLKSVAGNGPVLELAVGTGRIALPLAATGLRVDGIDFSPQMLAHLRAKPGGDQVSVTLADIVDAPIEGHYSLIFIVWNSFFNVLSQEDQVRCFQNVAGHLKDDGLFVIEAFVPAFLHALPGNSQVEAEQVETDAVRLGVLRHDAANQTIEQNHVTLSAEGLRFAPVMQRYVWPSELDLMARIAGLTLKDRFGGWRREPFTSDSKSHVSVYGR